MQALIVTKRGIAIVELQEPAPPMLEYWEPVEMPYEMLFDPNVFPAIQKIGRLVCGPHQSAPIYEESCRA
jgi:hypothetical protein